MTHAQICGGSLLRCFLFALPRYAGAITIKGLLIELIARSAEESGQRVLVHYICRLYVAAANLPPRSCLHTHLIYAVFEIVSAYGTVGLSLGVPSVESTSSEFSSFAFPLAHGTFLS